MKQFFCLVALVFFIQSMCTINNKTINVEFQDEIPYYDILHDTTRSTFEYYYLNIENNLYDTIGFILNRFNRFDVYSVQPSKIEYIKGNEPVRIDLTDGFSTPDDTYFMVPLRSKAKIRFLLPEFSNTTSNKIYYYLFRSDSASIKQYHYLKIYPSHSTRLCKTQIY